MPGCGGRKGPAAKSSRITSLGSCLIIAIERFSLSRITNETKKDMRAVVITERLNIPCGASGAKKLFRLREVVGHYGSTDRNGHYTAHVKRSEHRWLEYDDFIVRSSSTAEMERFGHKGWKAKKTP